MFYLLIMFISCVSSFSMASNEKPWTIHTKEDKVVQVNDQEKNQDMQNLFELIDIKSRLRQMCLSTVSEASNKTFSDYHCRKIADMLHCAKKDKTLAHKAYCGQADIKSSNGDRYWNETYHVKNLAEILKLTPQQTTKEIELFIETLGKLSK